MSEPSRNLALYDTFDDSSSLVSRFSIAILSSVLLGMALGRLLSPPVEIMAGAAGALGLFFYAYRLWVIHRNWETLQAAIRARAENRLKILASATGPSRAAGHHVSRSA